MEYVVGFRFNNDRNRVVLIEKNRPAWQRGRLNGVGGKVEPNESPHKAMIREFREDTGKFVDNWRLFTSLRGPWGMLYCFCSFGDLNGISSTTDEVIGVYEVWNLYSKKTVANLRWLVPMALDRDDLFGRIIETRKEELSL